MFILTIHGKETEVLIQYRMMKGKILYLFEQEDDAADMQMLEDSGSPRCMLLKWR